MSERAFYYDIVCPYAYMAFSFLQKSGVFKNNVLKLKPILLGGLFKHMNSDVDPNSSHSSQKSLYVRKDIMRQAYYFSAPLQFHKRHPLRTVSAMRLLHACSLSQREALTEALYKAYWQDNLDIDDDAVVDAIAHDFGLGDKASWHERAKVSLINATEQAFHKKVFGVPTIEMQERLYFGGDRLPLLAKELDLSLPDAPWQPSTDVVDFYYDFSSPYSYLAFSEVKKAALSGVSFRFIPILLGALFKEVGVANVPMLSAHQNKTEYYFQDMRDWARFRGVEFQFNSHFPLRSVTPLRVALVCKDAMDALFTAAWVQNLDIGDKEVLRNVLIKAGFDADDLLKRCEDDAIKEQLRLNTAMAFCKGVFGVPSFLVKGDIIFGQDRFSWIRMRLLDLIR